MVSRYFNREFHTLSALFCLIIKREPLHLVHSPHSTFQGHQVAVKTGTTNNLRDNWTVGYTQDAVVAVWVGNNDNTPMSYVASGITGASPIWNTIMRQLLNPDVPHVFEQPANVVTNYVCIPRPTDECPECVASKTEYFLLGTKPAYPCRPIIGGEFN